MSTLLFIFQLLLSLLVTPFPIPCQPEIPDPRIASISSPLMMSNDNGHSWIDLSQGLSGRRPMSFLAEDNEYFLGTGKGLYRGAPLLPAIQWENELWEENEIVGISRGKIGPYAISLRNGFYQYDPLSGSWVPMHLQLKDKNVQVVTELSDGTIVIGTRSGIYRSTDHGHQWHHALPSGNVDIIQVRNDVLFAFGEHGFFRSTDKGLTWTRQHLGTERVIFVAPMEDGWMAIMEGKDFAGVRSPNMVFQSSNDGASWEPFAYELPAALDYTYDIRQHDQYLFGTGNEGVYRSADGGKTWENVLKLPSEKSGFLKLINSEEHLFVLYMEGC